MNYTKVTDPRNSNELTRAYLDQLLVEPRYLDSCVPDLSMELYGRAFTSPIMIAAFSHLGKTHPGGMAEMSRGAAKAGICNWAGMGSEEELDSIIAAGAPTIKIVKPYADRQKVFRMLRHAKEAGALAVGMDIDHSFGARGYADVVIGEEMTPVALAELKEFVQVSDLPFIVKGVLSIQDAEKCAEAGVKGLLLSHHHGIMPWSVPPLMALPEIRRTVGEGIDLFVDCSIDSGEDAYKCLVLGAKAVCVGRAILKSFADQGADGVAEYIAHMNDGLRAMMARTCAKDLAHIPHDVLWDSATGKKL